MIKKEDRILILGGRGLVGSALIREFTRAGYASILAPNREELNLTNQASVDNYFNTHKPNVVINAAAKVGGIHANNTYRADFIYENLMIQNNLFKASFENEVDTFLFLGSSCIYPKNCPQPIREEYLLTAPLEPTNEPYAIAKIAGLKTAESFNRQYDKKYFSVMPTNLYGEGDNFHPENSHVIPGLINRMHETIESGKKEFEVWGTGTPKREFLYVDDLANACRFLLETDQELPHWINVGTGEDIAIKDLVTVIAKEMGFEGEIVYNKEYPDGTPRKLMNVDKVNNLGWKHQIGLEEGIQKTVKYFKENNSNLRRC